MQDQVRDWLIHQGFPEALEIAEMRRGLGSVELWTFSAAPEGHRMVVRLFPAGAAGSAEREALAMDAAARRGLPVPAPIARGEIAGRPVLVTPFATGELASQFLATHPEQAHAIGRALGEALGRLHQVPAPEPMTAQPHAWIDRGGQALAPIRQRLESTPNQSQLLHLDYHPNNVFIDSDAVTAIIDWENALAGPPHMDLARSRAILKALSLRHGAAREEREMISAFDSGLAGGHARVAGADPHSELSSAWGLSMTIADLTAQLGKPGMPVSREVLAALETERDALIASLAGA